MLTIAYRILLRVCVDHVSYLFIYLFICNIYIYY